MKRNGIPSPRTVARKGYARSPKQKSDQDGAAFLFMLIVCGTITALIQMGVI